MSAVGGVGSATGRTAAGDETPGRWGSFGAGLRLLVGWFSVAIALLNLLAELDRLPDRAYLLFHALLLVGGLLLISFGWGAAGRAGYAGFGAVLTGGMLGSALPANHAVCCMTRYSVRHGFPFTFLARDDGGGWHVDSPQLVADLLFWGYAGLIALVLVATARRISKHHGGGRK
jgi:hypothetical protein